MAYRMPLSSSEAYSGFLQQPRNPGGDQTSNDDYNNMMLRNAPQQGPMTPVAPLQAPPAPMGALQAPTAGIPAVPTPPQPPNFPMSGGDYSPAANQSYGNGAWRSGLQEMFQSIFQGQYPGDGGVGGFAMPNVPGFANWQDQRGIGGIGALQQTLRGDD